MNASENSPQPCGCLRTKNPYGCVPAEPESWLPGVHAASSYWCLRTMGPAGPDEQYVHIARCAPGRACYESPDE